MLPYTVRQGDQFMIPFIALAGQVQLIDTDVEDVEIVVGKLRKTLKNGEVIFNATSKTFDFPLLQKESYKFIPGTTLHTQIRTRLKQGSSLPGEDTFDGPIFSNDGPDIFVIASASKEYI